MKHVHDREFSRSASHREVEVTCGDQSITGLLRDVSLKGFYVVCQEPFPEATTVAVLIDLTGDVAWEIETMGRVTRSDTGGMAIEIEEISASSFQHLKRLVLLNSETPDDIEREISDHLGLKRRN